MGSAFTAIVTALVDQILMPLIGAVIGGIDLSRLHITIPWSLTGEPPVIYYGAFIQALLNFVIIALCVFFIVQAMNKLMKKTPPAPAKPTKDQELLTEIRDLLKAQNEANEKIVKLTKEEEK